MVNMLDFSTTPEWISFYVFAISAFLLVIYYAIFFSRMAFSRVKKNNNHETTKQQPVSVVICAKNEYQNLKNNIPKLLEQDYPAYEVILVNDFSQDDSYYLLKSYQEKYKNFRVINLRENVNFFEGKKLALALGIKSATYNTILLTDADCEPAGNAWIRSMSNCFQEKTEIVLGYGGYKKHPGFLNMLIRYDTFFIAMQYMGFAKAGLAYMGVGRNLAYKKDLFFRSGGFTSHYKINSGDDDLFINKVAKKNNTETCLHPDSFTFSEPEKNFSKWFKQKKRHLSTGSYYRLSHKLLLGTFAATNILFYISFAAYLYFQQTSLTLYLSLGLFLLKTFFLMLLCFGAGKRLGEKKLFWVSPIFDLTFAFLNPVFAVSNLFYKKNKWK